MTRCTSTGTWPSRSQKSWSLIWHTHTHTHIPPLNKIYQTHWELLSRPSWPRLLLLLGQLGNSVTDKQLWGTGGKKKINIWRQSDSEVGLRGRFVKHCGPLSFVLSTVLAVTLRPGPSLWSCPGAKSSVTPVSASCQLVSRQTHHDWTQESEHCRRWIHTLIHHRENPPHTHTHTRGLDKKGLIQLDRGKSFNNNIIDFSDTDSE